MQMQQAESGRLWSCCVVPCPALPCPALPWMTKQSSAAGPCRCSKQSLDASGHAVPCPALPCPALPCPALPCPALPCPALPCPALPCPALPGPAVLCCAVLCCAVPCRLCCAGYQLRIRCRSWQMWMQQAELKGHCEITAVFFLTWTII